MRAVLQRASSASVTVDGAIAASFDRQGIVALVGVTHSDGAAEAEVIARKIADLRILSDEQSVLDVGAPVIVVSQFTLYADTREDQYYQRFRKAIAVPLGDRDARIALDKSPPNLDAARTGFLQGGNDSDDIPGMIWLYRNFRSMSYLDAAIRSWMATDPVLDQLDHVGEVIHDNIADSLIAPELFRARKAEIGRINERLAPLAVAYSESLSAGSRAIKALLAFANMLTGGLLMLLVLWHTRKLMAQREAFENALRAEKRRAQVTLASIRR